MVPDDPPFTSKEAASSRPSVISELNRSSEDRKHSKQGSISSRHSSHQEYIDSLPVPPRSELERIESVQIQKEDKILESFGVQNEDRHNAAKVIQRNYRGYRERRQIRGLGLDPSSRWIEAFKEARYRQLTMPRPRVSLDESSSRPMTASSNDPVNDPTAIRKPREAKANWNKIGTIVKRAANDEDSSSDSSGEDVTAGEIRRLRAKKKEERQKSAKIMDLQYWLEMVDVKHRYGSNLRVYHQEWQRSESRENFFYWLDYGEGRQIECAGCPRETLDRERIRYLSKEERLDYLVKIDEVGRLCWAKNGARIDTTTNYRDSIHGIVPLDSDEPMFNPEDGDWLGESGHSTGSEMSSEEEATRHHYETDSFDNAKGFKKVKHVSPATIFNKLLRSSVKKNTWIFVADTNFRLYVGIKQSGAFQHSSFLHGSRISAAGLIKIKCGQLDNLSPLSGHYRPPVSSFRAFVHSLKGAGVDMSHVSISRSYAVLVGLEAYIKTRKRGKKAMQKLIHGRDKLLSPEELTRREEVETEKRILEIQEPKREENKVHMTFMRRLHIGTATSDHKRTGLEQEAE